MIIEIHSQSPGDTFKIGEKIGQQLKGDEIIFLKGELGAGKTLLTKGIARALGIEADEVVSPTFTLVNQFQGKDEQRFFHIDLYRLGPAIAGHLPEIDDYIDEGVIVVEWAQFLESSYFELKNSIQVTLRLVKDNENARILEINAQDRLLKELEPRRHLQCG
ncbi:MAG: tRNA (adenosine(37)-N6)-threonylcarbamoyltransferase complex ATPase subunit type 1 TsaE [Candidatus Aminicenantes bacterium]|nr:tRNA (adenosine(37)-N6)-threonylcarbamoyltransferase complex ATPase subunit type 1 TsaE [Candidatus Aminicenantes bacterium]NIM79640.1 tRNA (adenosine(37)-N6)-threonylcarbamoyltransferase complex ATPase subunit type 1 TsaE [Candidatus Aminicenantes bacterium]NIN18966.1 tRNA (adenosine(37)-N6)-threonylcarbamoyltransferase complex ATPase subunit type 1 TsaE [Candidatus Aminicenantes bacterium]NIN42868.1 tRNA (adenosine(37)-N6)-threonylcarbamoyltransferase complex ATPase subunit type 1 TsaE [Can